MSNDLTTYITETLPSVEDVSAAMMLFYGEGAQRLVGLVQDVEEQARALSLDASTKVGQAEIKTVAHRITRSKTALEAIGKAAADHAKAIPKEIDANRKMIKDRLDALRDEIRRPVTEMEERETARVDAHGSKIAAIKSYQPKPQDGIEKLTEARARLEAMDLSPDAVQEFADAYKVERDAAIERIDATIEAVRKDAEIEQLRKEKAAAEQREREARIAQEAADKAREDERRRQQQIEQQPKKDDTGPSAASLAYNAMQERAAMADRAQETAPNIAAEQPEETKIANASAKIAEAIVDLVDFGMDEFEARLAIKAIVAGKVRHIRAE